MRSHCAAPTSVLSMGRSASRSFCAWAAVIPSAGSPSDFSENVLSAFLAVCGPRYTANRSLTTSYGCRTFGPSYNVAEEDRRMVQHGDLRAPSHVRTRHGDRVVQRLGALPPEEPRHRRVVGSDHDHLPQVLAPRLPPVPHVKRMRAVIRVAAAVQLHVARVVGELVL